MPGIQSALSLEDLSCNFNLPEKQVAKKLGLCLTSLKKLCRKHGINRWPYRKLQSIEKEASKLQENMRAASSESERTSISAKLKQLEDRRANLPFGEKPCAAYGGVQRAKQAAAASTTAQAAFAPLANGMASMHPCTSLTTTSQAGSDGCSSAGSTPRLAAKLNQIGGSIEGHRCRISGTSSHSKQLSDGSASSGRASPTMMDHGDQMQTPWASLVDHDMVFEQPDDIDGTHHEIVHGNVHLIFGEPVQPDSHSHHSPLWEEGPEEDCAAHDISLQVVDDWTLNTGTEGDILPLQNMEIMPCEAGLTSSWLH